MMGVEKLLGDSTDLGWECGGGLVGKEVTGAALTATCRGGVKLGQMGLSWQYGSLMRLARGAESPTGSPERHHWYVFDSTACLAAFYCRWDEDVVFKNTTRGEVKVRAVAFALTGCFLFCSGDSPGSVVRGLSSQLQRCKLVCLWRVAFTTANAFAPALGVLLWPSSTVRQGFYPMPWESNNPRGCWTSLFDRCPTGNWQYAALLHTCCHFASCLVPLLILDIPCAAQRLVSTHMHTATITTATNTGHHHQHHRLNAPSFIIPQLLYASTVKFRLHAAISMIR